jgi:micrococcal nuclease
MRVVVILLVLLGGHKKNQSSFTLDTGGEHSDSEKKHSGKGSVILNGEKTAVNWTDGDSFKILEGPHAGHGTRMVGYNTLEAWGPVHRWGSWTGKELWDIERSDKTLAASGEWKCTTDGKLDGYKRLLIDCPDAAKEMVRQGHAMVYAVEGTKPSDELLKVQREAQEGKVGMWAKGVPRGLVSSVHSLGEEGGHEDVAYNRVVDTRTGEALKRAHHDHYETCQEICIETEGTSSCMTYVPFDRRYKNKPDCMRGER